MNDGRNTSRLVPGADGAAVSAAGGISLYTDGAAPRNPHGPAGWAWLAVFPDGSRRQGTGSFARASNNQAELTAALEGLNALSPGRVCVISDSKYVVKGMTDWARGLAAQALANEGEERRSRTRTAGKSCWRQSSGMRPSSGSG